MGAGTELRSSYIHGKHVIDWAVGVRIRESSANTVQRQPSHLEADSVPVETGSLLCLVLIFLGGSFPFPIVSWCICWTSLLAMGEEPLPAPTYCVCFLPVSFLTRLARGDLSTHWHSRGDSHCRASLPAWRPASSYKAAMVQMTAIAFWRSGIRVLYPEFNVLKVVTVPTLSSLSPHLFLRGRVHVSPWYNIRPGEGAWVHMWATQSQV